MTVEGAVQNIVENFGFRNLVMASWQNDGCID
jgi:hypothetical protein